MGGGEGAQFWGSWGKTPPEAAVYRRGAGDVPPSREVAAGGAPKGAVSITLCRWDPRGGLGAVLDPPLPITTGAPAP